MPGAGFAMPQGFSGAGTNSNERPMAMAEMVSVLSLLQRQVPQAVQAAMMDGILLASQMLLTGATESSESGVAHIQFGGTCKELASLGLEPGQPPSM